MRKGHVAREGGRNFPLESSWNNSVERRQNEGKKKREKKRKIKKRKEGRRK